MSSDSTGNYSSIRSEEREAALVCLHRIVPQISRILWSFLQVCDLTCLNTFIDMLYVAPAAVHAYRNVGIQTINFWIQKMGRNSQSSSTRSPVTSRGNQSAVNLAKIRDKNKCVLTGQSLVQAAHIYPYSGPHGRAESGSPRASFWETLQMFWPEDRLALWQQSIFPQGILEPGHDSIDNLISLSYQAHAMWNLGKSALKPISISEDLKELEVQFFWQPKMDDLNLSESIKGEMDCLAHPPLNQGLQHSPDNDFLYMLGGQGETIKSGYIFRLTTDDPGTEPLPSFHLLEMQWHLTRTVGMSGAAYQDTDEEDDSTSSLASIVSDWLVSLPTQTDDDSHKQSEGKLNQTYLVERRTWHTHLIVTPK